LILLFICSLLLS